MDSRKKRDEAIRQELAVPCDEYGRPIDPADGYKEFLYGLYYLIADAGDAGYSAHGLAKLKEARLRFIEEFEARHPERLRSGRLWYADACMAGGRSWG